jgi:hypothetical protein
MTPMVLSRVPGKADRGRLKWKKGMIGWESQLPT